MGGPNTISVICAACGSSMRLDRQMLDKGTEVACVSCGAPTQVAPLFTLDAPTVAAERDARRARRVVSEFPVTDTRVPR